MFIFSNILEFQRLLNNSFIDSECGYYYHEVMKLGNLV